MEPYRTIAAVAHAAITEKKSEFIATIAPAASEEEANALLARVKAAHRQARHNVYAYLLRTGARQRYSDDGEPSGTGGLPVLSVLEHAGLSDAVIVVTRYFGGVLLGTGGLVRAYTAAAQAALAAASIVTVTPCVRLNMALPYPQYEPVRRALLEAGADIAEPLFTDEVALSATLPAGRAEALMRVLSEVSAGRVTPSVSEPFYAPFGGEAEP